MKCFQTIYIHCIDGDAGGTFDLLTGQGGKGRGQIKMENITEIIFN